jgi:hypothetical protein
VPDQWVVGFAVPSAGVPPQDTLVIYPFYNDPTASGISRDTNGKPNQPDDPQCQWRYETIYDLCPTSHLGGGQYTKIIIGWPIAGWLGDVNCRFQSSSNACGTQPYDPVPATTRKSVWGNMGEAVFASHTWADVPADIPNSYLTDNPSQNAAASGKNSWWYVNKQSPPHNGGIGPDPGSPMGIGDPYCGVRVTGTTFTFRTKTQTEADCPVGCP